MRSVKLVLTEDRLLNISARVTLSQLVPAHLGGLRDRQISSYTYSVLVCAWTPLSVRAQPQPQPQQRFSKHRLGHRCTDNKHVANHVSVWQWHNDKKIPPPPPPPPPPHTHTHTHTQTHTHQTPAAHTHTCHNTEPLPEPKGGGWGWGGVGGLSSMSGQKEGSKIDVR